MKTQLYPTPVRKDRILSQVLDTRFTMFIPCYKLCLLLAMIMPVFSHPLPMESSKDNFELVARSTLNETAPRSLEYMANLDQAPEINIASQLTTKADPLLLRRNRNKRFDWRNFSPWSPFLGW